MRPGAGRGNFLAVRASACAWTPVWLLTATALALAAGVACDDPVEDRPASFSYIAAAIIEPSCATAACHSKLGSSEGIQLHTRDSAYTFLVGTGLVVPGQPRRSRLLYLLRGENTLRMPPDLPLPDADIELIERWILEGARNN